MKDAKWNMILIASLFMLGGLLLIIFPAIAADTIGYILGACLMGTGLVVLVLYFVGKPELGFYHFELVIGLGLMILGFVVILNVRQFLELMPLFLGLCVTLSGILKLQHAVNLLRAHVKGWLIVLIAASVSTILGVLLILNPFAAIKTLMIFLGIGFFISGLTDLGTTLLISRVMRREEKEYNELVQQAKMMSDAKNNVVDVIEIHDNR